MVEKLLPGAHVITRPRLSLLTHAGDKKLTRLPRRSAIVAFSADEACDVGSDTGSPASTDYGPTGNRFTGAIDWVQLDIGEDSHDHLISAQDRIKLAMGKQ